MNLGRALDALVATDLDRTLIYSAAAAGVIETAATGAAPIAAVPTQDAATEIAATEMWAQSVQCVEMYRGRPQSFMSPRAVELLIELDRSAVVVPTTTRTIEQFSRVELPIPRDRRRPRLAVAANGGEILLDGVPDVDWRREVDTRVAAGSAPLAEVTERLWRHEADPWVRSLRVAQGLFCYAVVDLASMPATLIDEWRGWAGERGWNVSRQGRKVYVMPDPLTKSAAIAEIRCRHDLTGGRFFATGDGVLDRPMLEAADRAIRPRHGELEELSWHHPTLSVTKASGLDAGAELLETLLIWVREPTPDEETR
ncbi:HAD family hydrolase [Williamsia sp. CHRR-6]|uniref:HAD family hydrolase n=1 Tax=Williamsia sp. CHRR-6 TaxID=2835871 RepID=UPI001BD9A089|nr:HAD family hydrolase [Williamsia sp. CHRR-6]MBT0568141.1 HAD family hydrolase [Williamsia sp. CHRR-6]